MLDEEWGYCADCGKRCMIAFMAGKWCEDCFDVGLTADMHEHFIFNMKKEKEESGK